jgi:hypothetical protein
MAIARGRAEGKKVESGGLKFVGTMICGRQSKNILAFLSHIIGVNEYEVDELGGYSFKCWEWK